MTIPLYALEHNAVIFYAVPGKKLTISCSYPFVDGCTRCNLQKGLMGSPSRIETETWDTDYVRLPADDAREIERAQLMVI